jgi:hypothetical protein
MIGAMSDVVDLLTRKMFNYCHLFDTGRFDEFADQFAHGQWHRADPGAPATRKWIDDRVLTYDGSPRTQHCTTNLIVEVDPSGHLATARSYVTVMQAVDGFPLQAVLGARYLDRFELVEGEWLWRQRGVETLVRGDTSRHVRSR